MIVGSVRENFPRVTLELPGTTGSVAVEFIVDSGFEGDLTLPVAMLRQVRAEVLIEFPD